MFTGIVEATGKVEELAPAAGPSSRRLTVRTELAVEALPLGASIAVDGVCLTVVDRGFHRFAADLGPELPNRTYYRNTHSPARTIASAGVDSQYRRSYCRCGGDRGNDFLCARCFEQG